MYENIGKIIKKYRGNLSLRDFAKKCDISHSHLDSIEKGIDPRNGKPVRVTLDTLTKIANAMNMSINELIGYQNFIPTKKEEKEISKFKTLLVKKGLMNENEDLSDEQLEKLVDIYKLINK